MQLNLKAVFQKHKMTLFKRLVKHTGRGNKKLQIQWQPLQQQNIWISNQIY